MFFNLIEEILWKSYTLIVLQAFNQKPCRGGCDNENLCSHYRITLLPISTRKPSTCAWACFGCRESSLSNWVSPWQRGASHSSGNSRTQEQPVHRLTGCRAESRYHLYDGGGMQTHRNRLSTLADGSAAPSSDPQGKRWVSVPYARNTRAHHSR